MRKFLAFLWFVFFKGLILSKMSKSKTAKKEKISVASEVNVIVLYTDFEAVLWRLRTDRDFMCTEQNAYK